MNRAIQLKTMGAGRAYQSVAQSTAIAIQDATDYLRNISTIATTAIGIGMAQVAAGQSEKGGPLITQAQSVVQSAVTAYSQIAGAAVQVATQYPQSFS